MIFPDPLAAFDPVNHHCSIFMSFLTILGMTGSAWQWFASYLKGHSYRVTRRGSTNASCRLSTGVCEGSALRRLLFLTHVLILWVTQYPHTASSGLALMTFNWSFPSHQQVVNYILACWAGTSSRVAAHHLKPKTTLLVIHTPRFGRDFLIALLENVQNLSWTISMMVMHSFLSVVCYVYGHTETW